MSSQSHDGAESTSKINLEGKYAELETEKEILKVDLEKIRVEKLHAEEKLDELKSEYDKLKKSFAQIKEEADQTRQLLNEQYEANIQEQNRNQNLQSEVEKLTEDLQLNYEDLAKKAEENEMLSKKLAESQQQQESQKGATAKGYEDDDDDAHKLCNEKYLALQEVYFKSEKKVNAMEGRENELCASEKAFGEEKKQLEETKKQLEAELQRHSASFLEKTQQLHSELQEARDREEILQKHVIDLQEREENLQEQVLQLITENDAMRVKIEKLTDLNTRRDTLYEERMKKFEKESKDKDKEKNGVIEMLQAQLGTVKEDRKKYLETSRVMQVEHDRLAYQHEALMKEYDELLNSFNGTLEENKMRSNNTTAEIQSYKGQMDGMAVNLASAEEELLKKDTIISDMRAMLRQHEEEIPVLKEQVSVYFNDFKAEREARERQQTDLVNLQEQNRTLTRENEELQMELDNMMNNQQMAEMQRRHLTPQQANQSFNPDAFATGFLRGRGEADQRERYEWLHPPRGPERRVQEPSQPEEPFPCQFCRRNFPHFEELQNHVRHCPQNDDRLLCPMCQQEFPDADTLQIHAQECQM